MPMPKNIETRLVAQTAGLRQLIEATGELTALR